MLSFDISCVCYAIFSWGCYDHWNIWKRSVKPSWWFPWSRWSMVQAIMPQDWFGERKEEVEVVTDTAALFIILEWLDLMIHSISRVTQNLENKTPSVVLLQNKCIFKLFSHHVYLQHICIHHFYRAAVSVHFSSLGGRISHTVSLQQGRKAF